ncbi:GTPase Era [Blastococcus sp. SYSU DS0539]
MTTLLFLLLLLLVLQRLGRSGTGPARGPAGSWGEVGRRLLGDAVAGVRVLGRLAAVRRDRIGRPWSEPLLGDGPAARASGVRRAGMSAAGGRLAAVTVPDQPYRSGFVALVGRPNAGKTTLTNAMVGEKVGIVSNRPQTTRHAIRGVVHRPGGQLVLVDTPGLHKPKSLLGKRLNDVVRDTLSDVDVIVFCIPADQPVGTGDKFIARQLAEVTAPVVVVVTKTDAAGKKQVTEQLVAASRLVEAAEVVPVSAVGGDQVELLEDLLIKLLPEGPPLYPEEQTTDEDVERQIAELIREAALEKVRQEVPHSLAVTVEEMNRRPDPKRAGGELVEVHALLHCERPSQKPMLLGKGGNIIKAIGTEARAGMETLLDARVHLELHVTVLGEWQDDPKKLNRLGY